MSAWGGGCSNSAFRSCDALLRRIERNDPGLAVLTILPAKQFGDAELDRLSAVLETAAAAAHGNRNRYWHTLAASGHAVSCAALERFGKAIATASAASAACPLRSVALGHVTMGDEGVAAFCRGLLTSLDSNDPAGEGAPGSNTVLSSSTSLTSLDLSYKGMSLEGFCSVAQLLRSCCCCAHLKCLNLSRNSFKQLDDSANSTFSGGPLFVQVHEMDLTSCEIDATLAAPLFRKLFREQVDNQTEQNSSSSSSSNNNNGPRTLRLGNNPLQDAGWEELLVSGVASLLDALLLSNCQLTDAALERWVQEQSSSTSSSSSDGACWPWVRTLDLSHNALTAHGMTVWCSSNVLWSPLVLPALQEINLAGNALGSDGVEAFMEGLRQRFTSSSSEESAPLLPLALDLSETMCGPAGAVAAVRGTCQHGVSSLRLYNNQLGTEGLDAVAQALADGYYSSSATETDAANSKLETLDLAGNGASQASIVKLLQVVLDLLLDDNVSNKGDFKLQCLVIGGNQGGEDVEEMVGKIHQIRPSIDIARDKLRKR